MSEKKFHDDDLYVQTLKPPYFEPTGEVVARREAWEKGYWYPTVNLWVVQSLPAPSVLYQQRNPNIGWAPGKLDVLIAGHCEHLQTPHEALEMEAREEMGVVYPSEKMISLGKKLSVGVGQDGTVRNSVVNIYMIEDNQPITRFLQQKKEVHAICAIPLDKLIQVHLDSSFSFTQKAIKYDGEEIELTINQEIFPPNWDPYHQKIAFLINRYFNGEKNLIY